MFLDGSQVDPVHAEEMVGSQQLPPEQQMSL
jgi:hypothetical protein